MLTQLNMSQLSFKHANSTSWVFKDISLSLTPGLYGLFGPNGSGKTTLLKCIAGVYQPQVYSGKITLTLRNQNLKHQQYKERVGYTSQEFAFYEEMNVEPYLRYVAEMKLIPRRLIAARIDLLLNRYHLDHLSGCSIQQLSTGQRKRLMLVQSLLAEPDLILLDEPLEGLDVEERNHVMEQLQQLAEQRIIIITSHIITEIEHWLEKVIFMTRHQVTVPRTPSHWKTCMLHDICNGQYNYCNSDFKYESEPTLENVYFWITRTNSKIDKQLFCYT